MKSTKYTLLKVSQSMLYDGTGGLPDNRATLKSLYRCHNYINSKSTDQNFVYFTANVEGDFVRRVGFTNLEQCHNSIVCPVCAAKRAAEDKTKLNKLVSIAESQGLQCIPTTQTIYHTFGESLPDLIARLQSQQRQFLGSGNRLKRFKERYGIIGFVQAFEVTLSIDYKAYNLAWHRYITHDPEFVTKQAKAREEYISYVDNYYKLSNELISATEDRNSVLCREIQNQLDSYDSSYPEWVKELRKYRRRYCMNPEYVEAASTLAKYHKAYNKAIARSESVVYRLLADRFAYSNYQQFVDYHPHFHTLWICKPNSYDTWSADESALKSSYLETAEKVLKRANIPVASLSEVMGSPILDDSGEIKGYSNSYGTWAVGENPVIPAGVVNPQHIYDRGFFIGKPVHNADYITKVDWGAGAELTAKDSKQTKAFWKMTPFSLLSRSIGKPHLSSVNRAVWNEFVLTLKHKRRLQVSRGLDKLFNFKTAAKEEYAEIQAQQETQMIALCPYETFLQLREQCLLDRLCVLVRDVPVSVAYDLLFDFVCKVLPNAPPLIENF